MKDYNPDENDYGDPIIPILIGISPFVAAEIIAEARPLIKNFFARLLRGGKTPTFKEK